MQIDKAHIQKLAHLAKLKLTEEESNRLQHDLNHILTWVEKLSEVNTEGVEPLISPCQEINVWREDEPAQPLEREKAMGNAPQADNPFILVPKVIT